MKNNNLFVEYPLFSRDHCASRWKIYMKKRLVWSFNGFLSVKYTIYACFSLLF